MKKVAVSMALAIGALLAGCAAEALLEYGGHQVIFTDDLSGCGGVSVTSDGKPQPDLSGGGDAPFAELARGLANRP
jgi:hypothetical protein